MRKKQKECNIDLPKVNLPLTEEQKSMIAEWEKADESLSPIMAKESGGKIELKAKTDRGSDQEKLNLLHAGLCLATGTKASSFGVMLLESLMQSLGLLPEKGKEVEKSHTAILDALYAMKPTDEIEGMLITRLIALHFHIAKQMQILNMNGLTVEQVDTSINRSTKLSRLYNETVETLSKYRRKGEQKVIVQHVNINEGGKAIVGHFQAGGGG